LTCCFNFCYRTGEKGRIQVSESTGKELEKAGKGHWIKERVDRVVAKGKGELRTYWLEPRKKGATAHIDDEDQNNNKARLRNMSIDSDDEEESPTEQSLSQFGQAITLCNAQQRLRSISLRSHVDSNYRKLIGKNTDVILKYLAQIVASRGGGTSDSVGGSKTLVNHDSEPTDLPPAYESVTDVIVLPGFQPLHFRSASASSLQSIRGEVRSLVSEIACLYNEALPYHNFEVRQYLYIFEL